MASVLVPVAYIIIVFGGLFVFSYFYRRHTSSMRYTPLFPLLALPNILQNKHSNLTFLRIRSEMHTSLSFKKQTLLHPTPFSNPRSYDVRWQMSSAY
jgi:hypothetical protein